MKCKIFRDEYAARADEWNRLPFYHPSHLLKQSTVMVAQAFTWMTAERHVASSRVGPYYRSTARQAPFLGETLQITHAEIMSSAVQLSKEYVLSGSCTRSAEISSRTIPAMAASSTIICISWSCLGGQDIMSPSCSAPNGVS